MSTKSKELRRRRNPWYWIPTLYFAEGLPYIIVMSVSVTMFKRMGVSNAEIALYTSWLYLPWIIKPLWSPVIDIFRTKRFWISIMQVIVGGGLAGVAFSLPVPNFLQYTLAFLWLLAFSSATHDIAADGFYMLGLTKHEQAFFVGIRSTFYRFAMLAGQGILVIIAGFLETATGLPSVERNVMSAPGKPAKEIAIQKKPFEAEEGEMRLMVSNEDLKVSTETMEPEEAAQIKEKVKSWNIGQDFYEEVKKQKETEKSWWQRKVSDPLKATLEEQFAQKKEDKVDEEAGNFALISIHLSRKPDEDQSVEVNFGRIRGDKSISLVEGGHYEFDQENWNKPAYALIQLDPKLDRTVRAVFEARAGNVPLAWSITFFVIAGLFVALGLYHKFILPYPKGDKPVSKEEGTNRIKQFLETFASYFRKKDIGLILAVLLLYRLAEAQIVKMETPFLLDPRELGGLALTTGDVGLVYGITGMLALTLGGILGGIAASKHGLKRWIWWMLIAMNVPNLVYIYLSYAMPESFVVISAAVGVEQFGYGFGFTAYMLYMIYVSEGEHKTSHFAISTGFMALGMMLPGMLSGWLQEIIGYQSFFIWVMLCTIPIFLIMPFVKIDPKFGTKESNKED